MTNKTHDDHGSIPAQCEDDIKQIRQRMLERYGFTRTQPDGIGRLLGNKEMGGLSSDNGLGIPVIWCAGYWSAPDARAYLNGPQLSCAHYRQPTTHYEQTLDIRNGMLTTKTAYANGTPFTRLAFAYLGLPDLARKMAEWHYKPDALKANASFYLEGDRSNPDAMSFAHELGKDGFEMASPRWRSQRHIDGFAPAFFHRLSAYYPDEAFKKDQVYSVLRGTAEFWRSIAIRDEERNGYSLPEMLSVSENSREASVLDAVIAARYSLTMAARYADAYGLDADLSKQWVAVANDLIIPLKMMVQSYDNTIRPFPAVPSAWKDVAFYNVPAEAGIRVSGRMCNGEVEYVEYRRHGELLRRNADDLQEAVDGF